MKAIVRNPSPLNDLVPLGNEGNLLPKNIPVRMTRRLWDSLAGPGECARREDRVREISFFLLFAVLGLTGSNREQTDSTESILLPTRFYSGGALIRATVHHDRSNGIAVTLSLPPEQILAPVYNPRNPTAMACV